MSIYSFEPGPKYRALTPQAAWDTALSSPLGLGANLLEQGKAGALSSYVLGSTIRDTLIPQGNVERSTLQIIDAMTPGIGTAKEAVRGLVQNYINPDQPSLSEDEWKASPSYRENIPYDPGMTEARGAALAAWDDARKVREHFASKRPFSSFVGNLGGQALDPVNYVPVFGELVKAAAVAKAGKIAGTALVASGDAAANTALAAAATYDTRGSFGDEVSWQGTISEIATAALIGGAFGTIGGAIGARSDAKAVREATDRLSTLRTTQEARIALNEAIDGIVSGEDIRLSPNSTEPLARVASEIPAARVATDTSRVAWEADMTAAAKTAWQDSLAKAEADRAHIAGGGDPSATPSNTDYTIGKRGETTSEVLAGIDAKIESMKTFTPPDLSGKGPQAAFEIWRGKKEGSTSSVEPPVPDGFRRVYHSGAVGEGETGRWVSTNRQYASDYRGDLPLHYLDIPKDDPRVNNPDYADQGPDQGFTFNFETTAAEAAKLREIARGIAPSGQTFPAIDTSPASPDPIPEGRAKAEQSLAKAETYKATAEQYRVDPETGSYVEEAEIKQLETEGRLSEQDKADLEAAAQIHENGVAYGEALRAAANCLV